MDPEDDDTGLTRRQILAGGAASLIAGSCGDGGATDGEQDTEGEDTGTDGGDDSGAVPIPEGMSAVAIVHREAIGDAVRRAIEAAVYKAQPLPQPDNPRIFQRDLRITFKPEQ